MPINVCLVKRTVPIRHQVGNFLLSSMAKPPAKQPVGPHQSALFVWLNDNKVDMKEASQVWLRRNPAYIHQYIFKGSPRYLPEAERKIVAKNTGLSEDVIGRKPIDGEDHISSDQIARGHRNLPTASTEAAMVPMYGVVEGGGGELVTTWEIVEYTDRPPPLKGIRNGYGMFVVGDSMEPAYSRGNRVFVNPNQPPRTGDDVLLFKGPIGQETAGIIKRIVKVTTDIWHVEQFNPPQKFALKRSEWQNCHVVAARYPR